jgi:hypothetical protein
MPNSHFSRFNQLILEKKSFQEALVQTHGEYLAELLKASKKLRSRKKKTEDEKLRRALRGFRKHIETATVGNLVMGYEFKIALPPAFEEFLKLLKMKEHNIINAPSPLLEACQTKMAQEGHSPQVIYAQLFKLEQALQAGEVKNYHLAEVQYAINDLSIKLYEKLAYLILHSQNVEELEAKAQEAFPLAMIDEVPEDSKLAFFKHESDSQIEFLLETAFLTYFYTMKTLAQKYNFTFNYYQILKTRSKLTDELRATLAQLFYLIVETAYAPCEAEKFKLMRENGATIEEVFTALKEWTKINWQQHQENDFINHLQTMLSQEYEEYLAWIDVRIYEGDVLASQKPMYHLFSRIKYEKDNTDPHALLKAIASPRKPHAKAVVATTPVPLLHSLEQLEDEEVLEDKENNPALKVFEY